MESEYVRDYINSFVKIELENGYYYRGKIISVGEESLVLIDKLGKRVVLSLKIIIEIKEVEEGI